MSWSAGDSKLELESELECSSSGVTTKRAGKKRCPHGGGTVRTSNLRAFGGTAQSSWLKYSSLNTLLFAIPTKCCFINDVADMVTFGGIWTDSHGDVTKVLRG